MVSQMSPTENCDTRSEWSHERLVAAAAEFGQDLGRSPTTDEAAHDDRFPSLATIYRYANGGWLSVLDDAGLERTQVRGYGPGEEPRMCRDLYGAFMAVETPYLTHRQYDDLGAYPTSVVKEQFGSWRDACDTASIPSGQKHGKFCEGPHGERLESQLERAVAGVLVEHDIQYLAHPRIEDTAWIADFYLPSCELWVEVDGYATATRPNERNFARKLEYLDETDEDFVVVGSPDDLIEILREQGAIVGK